MQTATEQPQWFNNTVKWTFSKTFMTLKEIITLSTFSLHIWKGYFLWTIVWTLALNVYCTFIVLKVYIRVSYTYETDYNFFPFFSFLSQYDHEILPTCPVILLLYTFFLRNLSFIKISTYYLCSWSVALCMLSLEILLPSMSLSKYFLYQKERAEIVPKGTFVKEKVFKWFLLWQAQNLCACSQYIQDYDSACLQHKGKAHFSCAVYTKYISKPPYLQWISLLLVQTWRNPITLISWLKVAMYLS